MRISTRKSTIAIALCAALALAALCAAPALAKRTYDSEIPGFHNATSASFDSAGDVWISDGGQFLPQTPGQNGIYKYNAYPSQTLLEVPNTLEPFAGTLGIQLNVDQSNGYVFVAQFNGRRIDIFAPGTASHPCATGETICYLTTWTSINGQVGFNPGFHVAIDNSTGFSRGRVYLALATPEDDVEAVDPLQRPIDFPATASYLNENHLTGTPSGPFGEVQEITVDTDGNIYVTDAGKKVIDEFASTGLFLRSFPAPQAVSGRPGTGGVGVDPTNGNLLITEGEYNAETNEGGITELDSSGNYLETLTGDGRTSEPFVPVGTPAVSSAGYLYAPVDQQFSQENDRVDIFTPAGAVPEVAYGAISSPTTTAGTLHASVDPNGGGEVTACHFEYGASIAYGSGPLPCVPATHFTATTNVSATIAGLTTEDTYHYRVVVENANGVKYGSDQTYTPHGVLGLSTEAATEIGEGSAKLHALFLGNGEAVSYHFEWGTTEAYGNEVGAGSASPAAGVDEALSPVLSGLTPFTTYHYRVVATDGAGTSYGDDMTFTTNPGIPTVGKESASDLHADRAILHAEANPNGAETTVAFEYVTDAEYQISGFEHATKTAPEVSIGRSKHAQTIEPKQVVGLQPGTLYHYRAVATNSVGVGTSSADRTLTTFPFQSETNDTCPNAHVRQQTGAALLLDCRAYELVSAANAGGYDVESSLVAGQTPFGGYPQAESPSRVLYGVHNGAIPGTGHPTNHGIDPYVATRGENGWTTTYVGIPADDPAAPAPFASTLEGADGGLNTFAFGGPGICSPCFEDQSTGSPIHKPNGELIQGMGGSISQPAAVAAGFIGKDLSADGTHFVFGSTSKFEPDGGEGQISIYDRDLGIEPASSHVVSKTPAGLNLPCLTHCSSDGIGELDISSDGSRIVVGQLVSEVEGAKYWHLYMNVGDSAQTVDLTPGTTSGVLFDGMTSDGSRVFFSTVDPLSTGSNQDTDNSVDLYEAEVSKAGTMALSRISTGTEGTGNSDLCNPAANSKRAYWNTAGTNVDCSIVAVGGGGGVASTDGAVYFLSPERLDGSGNGVQNAPNLYLARPGVAPHFVATLESSANAPLPKPVHPFLRSYGSFAQPTGIALSEVAAEKGDTYVLDLTAEEAQGYVQKFDPTGHVDTSFGTGGKIDGKSAKSPPFEELAPVRLPAQIAVDNAAASKSHGDLYVPNIYNGLVGKYSSSGAFEGSLTAELPTGVAVDPESGDVFVTELFGGVRVFDDEGNEIRKFTTISEPTGVAVAPGGNVYVVNGGGISHQLGKTEIYSSTGKDLGLLDGNPSYGVAVDPSTEDVFVNEGNQVSEFDPAGNPVGAAIGSGTLSRSVGLTASGGSLDIVNAGSGSIAAFGPSVTPSDPATDNPLVVDSVSAPGLRNTGDFQISPSGDDAVFTSTLPLSGYDNAGHREVFRNHAPTDTLDCASCNPTGEQAGADSTLAPNGLDLTNEGRVFFNSNEGLVDRDLNNNEDPYEWEPQGFNFGQGAPPCTTPTGCVQLISTGTSTFDSRLLGVTADGRDAYFFTRDKLVEGDENGSTVKIYDARELGGFPFVPTAIQCKASDECHGAGSTPPPPPNISSAAGPPESGAAAAQKCKAGSVKKHGKCAHKPKKARRHHNARHRRKAHRHG